MYYKYMQFSILNSKQAPRIIVMLMLDVVLAMHAYAVI